MELSAVYFTKNPLAPNGIKLPSQLAPAHTYEVHACAVESKIHQGQPVAIVHIMAGEGEGEGILVFLAPDAAKKLANTLAYAADHITE